MSTVSPGPYGLPDASAVTLATRGGTPSTAGEPVPANEFGPPGGGSASSAGTPPGLSAM